MYFNFFNFYTRFPCRETICEEVPGSNLNDGLAAWAVALIICSMVVVIGLLTAFFLKNRCERGLTFLMDGILAAILTPPILKNPGERTIRAQNMDLKGQGGQALMPTAPPPNYDEIWLSKIITYLS